MLCSLATFAGCYQDTGLIYSGLPFYTPSGLDLPHTFLGAFDIDASDDTSASVRNKQKRSGLGYILLEEKCYDGRNAFFGRFIV